MPGSRVGGERQGAVGHDEGRKNIKRKFLDKNNIITKLYLLIIILLLLSLPILMIRNDVLGIGEKLRPFIEDLPYISKVLPPSPDPHDPHYMNKAELIENYLEYKHKYEQLVMEKNALHEELDRLSSIRDNYDKLVADQQKLQEDRLKLQEDINLLEEERHEFFQEIKEAGKADFKAYFEKIYPEKAAQLYSEILEKEREDESIREAISYYENMDPSRAAKIFEEMSNTDMALVVNVLKNMNREQASEILANIKVEIAAQISNRILSEYPIFNTP